MDKLRAIHDEVFYLNGVERSKVQSLFASSVRYTEVVEDGFTGDVIISSDFQGTDEQLARVKTNVLKSDWVGRIVARDMSAAMVVATLQDNDPETGKRLDLQAVAGKLEAIRQKYEDDKFTVHIIGFANAVGDIASGAAGVLVFFAVAFVITTLLLYWYSGSAIITALAIICAVVPVIWLLGLLPIFGLGLDPMSILVPFLIFSIGVSHAVQMTSAWGNLSGLKLRDQNRNRCRSYLLLHLFLFYTRYLLNISGKTWRELVAGHWFRQAQPAAKITR